MHFTHTLSIFTTVIALASAAPNCGIPCNPITECTSTSTTVASCFNGGPTATVYDATVTVTSSVNCAGCEILDITTRYRPCPVSPHLPSFSWLRYRERALLTAIGYSYISSSLQRQSRPLLRTRSSFAARRQSRCRMGRLVLTVLHSVKERVVLKAVFAHRRH